MISIKINKGLITHNCVQCGAIVQYYENGNSDCTACKAGQRLFNVSRSTEIQYDFILGQPIWRVGYHIDRTNCT